MKAKFWKSYSHKETVSDPERPEGSVTSILHEGVPEWMASSLLAWQGEALKKSLRIDPMGGFHQIERSLRVQIAPPRLEQWDDEMANGYVRAILKHFWTSEELTLKLTEYLLSLVKPTRRVESNSWLKEPIPEEDWKPEDLVNLVQEPDGDLKNIATILKESGSAFTIGVKENHIGLVRRVEESIEKSFTSLAASSQVAGHTLAKAWGEAFGRNPNPSAAYRYALEAVEDAAIPALGLGHKKTDTLGTVIRIINGSDFEAQGWTLPFQNDDIHYSSGKTLVAMMKTLQAGQTSRHGNGKQRADITQEAAEAAVFLAITLVQLFKSGAVTKKTN